MSARVSMTISAQNFENTITKNFSSAKWENPVNVNLTTATIGTPTLQKDDINTTTEIGFTDGNITITWNETNSSKNLRFNFQRDENMPLEPFKVPGADVNLTATSIYTAPTSGATKDVNSSSTSDQNATFYYGRVHSQDYRFSSNPDNATIYYEVYCDGCNKVDMNITGNESTDSINWYVNTLHITDTSGNIAPTPISTGLSNLPLTPNALNTGFKVLPITATSVPHKNKIQFNSDSWLINNPTDFLVEFYEAGADWAGEGQLGATVDTNVSTRQNRRIDW